MKVVLAVLASSVAVASCGHWPGAERDFARELARPDSAFRESEPHYYGIEDGQRPSFAQVRAMNFPESGAPRSDLVQIRDADDRRTVTVIRTHQEDDSIEAEHLRFLFRWEASDWRFERVLARYRCNRGKPGRWTSGLCP